jgi:hypothetical protein
MQRQYEIAVLVVHHAKKGGGSVRAGQALRGSSEFHAWGDSLLYLRRQGETLVLSAEHRAAPGIDAIPLRLRTDDEHLALEIVASPPVAPPVVSLPVSERIRQILAAAPGPLALRQLREACRLRKTTLCQALAQLTERGELLRTDGGGYQLTQRAT